jgi:Mn2+/Fe2+ NRAMP family transporter
MNLNKIGRRLGPGILFAASSVGTSHLVQSTRAGADYGLVLWGIILFAMFVRYPAYRFGAEYAAATGRTLIDSYFRQGRWAITIFSIEVLVNMFIATAAIALVTSGILNHIMPTGLSNVSLAYLILIGGAVTLVAGQYHLLERVSKVFMVIFTAIILVAGLSTAPDLQITPRDLIPVVELDTKTILFIIALAGWMPAPMVASTFQSIWVCAKAEDIGRPVTVSEMKFDFNVGYIITAVLAICFLVLGTVLMGQQGIEVAQSSSEFAGQLVSLFTGSIGAWSYWLIVIAILAIMLSTAITLLDACPRAISILLRHRDEQQGGKDQAARNRIYNVASAIQVITCIIVLTLFTGSFRQLLDFVTSIAFVVAPFLAFLNHRAMFSADVEKIHQPGVVIRLWSMGGIILMALFAGFYLKIVVL